MSVSRAAGDERKPRRRAILIAGLGAAGPSRGRLWPPQAAPPQALRWPENQSRASGGGPAGSPSHRGQPSAASAKAIIFRGSSSRLSLCRATKSELLSPPEINREWKSRIDIRTSRSCLGLTNYTTEWEAAGPGAVATGRGPHSDVNLPGVQTGGSGRLGQRGGLRRPGPLRPGIRRDLEEALRVGDGPQLAESVEQRRLVVAGHELGMKVANGHDNQVSRAEGFPLRQKLRNKFSKSTTETRDVTCSARRVGHDSPLHKKTSTVARLARPTTTTGRGQRAGQNYELRKCWIRCFQPGGWLSPRR
jgi:hypothetical protein